MKLLTVTSRSATFELSGTSAYYHGGSYEILLNGKKIGIDERNVFSVFSLEPGKEYLAKALGINKLGELLVRKEDGSTEAVFAGEVSVRGIYGYV